MISIDSHIQITSEIISLLKNKGDNQYFKENVTQLEHALQSAEAAKAMTPHDHIVIAALLHDIGHILESEQESELGHIDHDILGAEYLSKKGFGTEVTHLIRYHVEAKRYLVATDEIYFGKLSHASRETLEKQGGAMSPEEIKLFENLPEFEDIIKVRLCDDLGKREDMHLSNLESYRSMIENYLLENRI